MNLWLGAHYEVRDIRYAQAFAMRGTRGPAELADPARSLERIQAHAWHRACHNALAEIDDAANDLHSTGPRMLWLLRRAASLCPGPTKAWNVGGAWIT